MTQIYPESAVPKARDDGTGGDSDGSYFDGGSDSEMDIGDLDTPARRDTPSQQQHGNINLTAFQSARLAELGIRQARSTPPSSTPYVRAFLCNPLLVEYLLRNAVLSMSDVKRLALVSHAFVVPARRVLFAGRCLAFHTPSQISRALDTLESTPEITSLAQRAAISFADPYQMFLETDVGQRGYAAERDAQDRQEPTYFWNKTQPDPTFNSSKNRRGPALEGPQPWLLEILQRVGKRASGDVIEAARKNSIRRKLLPRRHRSDRLHIIQELVRLYSEFSALRSTQREISFASFPPLLLDRFSKSVWFRSLRELKFHGVAGALAALFLPHVGD